MRHKLDMGLSYFYEKTCYYFFLPYHRMFSSSFSFQFLVMVGRGLTATFPQRYTHKPTPKLVLLLRDRLHVVLGICITILIHSLSTMIT